MADTATPDAPAKTLTKYVILVKQKDIENAWLEVKTRVPARSAEAALKALLDGAPTDDGAIYAAIPERSWKPVTVTVATTTTVKLT